MTSNGSPAAFTKMLLAAILSAAGADGAAGQNLKYSKQATRQATYEAALKANDLPVLGPWRQVGPFDPILRRPQPPQEQPAGDKKYALFSGGSAGWSDAPDYLDGCVNILDLAEIKPDLLKREPTVCLGRTVVADRDRELTVYLGADAGFDLWLNGEPVFYTDTIAELIPGQEKAVLPLRKGENHVVLKLKVNKQPLRFFFMPELGAELADALMSRLNQDFPIDQPLAEGYREKAALLATATEDEAYPLTEIPVPPGVFLEGGGMDFLPDGRLAVSTRRGYVYLVSNLEKSSASDAHFHRFASGLHEGLGLKVVDGEIHVVERGALTRLLDTDGDGVADRFENLCNAWGLSGNYHEYAYGLEQDAQGNLYVALNVSFIRGAESPVPYRGWVVRVRPDGEMEPFCFGFRSPNGMGTNAAGDIFVTDNQGEWVPASPLYHLRKDHFFGHPVSLRWTKEALDKGWAPTTKDGPGDWKRTPAAVWMPYEELSQSATDVVCDLTGGRFGPFSEQLFVGDMTKGTVVRVQLEKVQGEYQGACFLFRRGCGAVNRMAFGPDGRLYLSRANRGWGGGGLGEGLARLEYSGKLPFEIHSIHLRPDGFQIRLTKPIANDAVLQPQDVRIEQYGYNNWSNYGSPKIDRRALPVKSMSLSADRQEIHLTLDGLTAGRICQITLPRLAASDGGVLLHPEGFYTINALAE